MRLELIDAGAFDDSWDLLGDVGDEVFQVATGPGLDGGDLFADGGATLLDGLLLAGELALDVPDAAGELLHGHLQCAPSGADPLVEDAASGDGFSEGVVEQDATALLGQVQLEVIHELRHAGVGAVVDGLLGADGEEPGGRDEPGEVVPCVGHDVVEL